MYWYIQQQEIACYCETFGGPDLMVTLTFGNKWPKCYEFLNHLKTNLQYIKNPTMNCCGIETMYI